VQMFELSGSALANRVAGRSSFAGENPRRRQRRDLSPNFRRYAVIWRGVWNARARSFDLVRTVYPQSSALRACSVALRRAARRLIWFRDCLARALPLAFCGVIRKPSGAWLFYVLHKHYVNDVARRIRDPMWWEIQDYFPAMAVAANQTTAFQLKRLLRAIQGLPGTRNARHCCWWTMKVLATKRGRAEITGVRSETVMSRDWSRAREQGARRGVGEDRTRGRSATVEQGY